MDVLSKAHPLKQNINKNERKMIRSLAKKKNVMVLPANRGKAAVIMDTEKYMEKIRVMRGCTRS